MLTAAADGKDASMLHSSPHDLSTPSCQWPQVAARHRELDHARRTPVGQWAIHVNIS